MFTNTGEITWWTFTVNYLILTQLPAVVPELRLGLSSFFNDGITGKQKCISIYKNGVKFTVAGFYTLYIIGLYYIFNGK